MKIIFRSKEWVGNPLRISKSLKCKCSLINPIMTLFICCSLALVSLGIWLSLLSGEVQNLIDKNEQSIENYLDCYNNGDFWFNYKGEMRSDLCRIH